MIRISVVGRDDVRVRALAEAFGASGAHAHAVPQAERGELLAAVAAHRADVVVLELDLGEPVEAAVSVIRPLQALGIKVLAVAEEPEREHLYAAVEAGADAIMDVATPASELLDAALRLERGERLIPDTARLDVATEMRRHRRRAEASRRMVRQLTVREREVLSKLVEGHSFGAIADALVVPESTVRMQVRGILSKLGVGSPLEAVALATRTATIPMQRRP